MNWKHKVGNTVITTRIGGKVVFCKILAINPVRPIPMFYLQEIDEPELKYWVSQQEVGAYINVDEYIQ